MRGIHLLPYSDPWYKDLAHSFTPERRSAFILTYKIVTWFLEMSSEKEESISFNIRRQSEKYCVKKKNESIFITNFEISKCWK